MAAENENTPPQTPKENGSELNEEELQKADKPLHELLTQSLVDIYVGPEANYTLHEKLLCYHSPVLRSHFYSTKTRNTSYGLPDDDPATFEKLVGWLYSKTLSFPVDEDKDVNTLLDLYLLAEKLQMAELESDCVETVRNFYQMNQKYPELRRVQYIYANTEADNAMREMMISSVARSLTLGESIPKHWDSALRRDGQLAVDIIRAIQEWHLEGETVPDVRSPGSMKGGFSKIEGSEMGDTESVAQSVSGVNGN